MIVEAWAVSLIFATARLLGVRLPAGPFISCCPQSEPVARLAAHLCERGDNWWMKSSNSSLIVAVSCVACVKFNRLLTAALSLSLVDHHWSPPQAGGPESGARSLRAVRELSPLGDAFILPWTRQKLNIPMFDDFFFG
ncbi:hypothetical protein RRG08_062640 [Elysia crispata]|uniref:Secreted protein n=1 Tax=Elysia crispata TaxID=231223 RepID=A0AAE1D7R3_9GAST|nr:hypothetical protein RRG08_062640 [Elysia crispata]